jgi:NAD(P)-dependent dehydrogenase (short-subunit alcohol dehydrogenase family)
VTARTDKRVAVVTGAGQGLGRTIAIALSAAGFDVAAVGRTESKLKDTVVKLAGKGLAVAADLRDPNQVRAAFAATAAHFGGVDVLINCAADYTPVRLDEATDAHITDMIATSMTGAIFCMREAILHMRKRGGGDIVNITTQSVEFPQPFMTVYSAAKAGIETISTGLRYELKGEDFRIMVCQIGAIADSIPNPGFLQGAERIFESWRKTGLAPMYPLPGTPPAGIAAAVVHAVTAPRDVYLQIIKLRGTDAAS